MKMLKDCSEVQEARDLLLKLMGEAPAPRGGARTEETTEPLPAIEPATQPPELPAAPRSVEEPLAPDVPPEGEDSTPLAALVAAPPPAAPLEPLTPDEPEALIPPVPTQPDLPATRPDERPVAGSSRGGRLDRILADLCAHEGFTGAMITDSSGLPLAVSSSPAASENLAAFTTVLGDALAKAGGYLDQEDARSVSLDINDREKAVLQRFAFEGRPYFLLALCLQNVEARRELDRAVPEIMTALGAQPN